MKKSTKWQTVISVILIIAVLAFGVIAYLTAQRDITSVVKINIPDNAVRIKLQGDATWITDASSLPSDVEKTHNTDTISAGTTDTWRLPDITWDKDSLETPSILAIKIVNDNPEVGLDVSVAGIRFDNYGRYSTKAYFQIESESVDPEVEQEISASQSGYSFQVAKEFEYATLFIEYALLGENSSFAYTGDLAQKIILTIKSEG